MLQSEVRALAAVRERVHTWSHHADFAPVTTWAAVLGQSYGKVADAVIESGLGAVAGEHPLTISDVRARCLDLAATATVMAATLETWGAR